MSENKKQGHRSFYLECDAEGVYTLAGDSPERMLQLTPTVAEVLWRHIERAIDLQNELDKIEDPSKKKDFPLEMIVGVIQGRGFFQALTPEIVAGQQLRGAFGVVPKGES